MCLDFLGAYEVTDTKKEARQIEIIKNKAKKLFSDTKFTFIEDEKDANSSAISLSYKMESDKYLGIKIFFQNIFNTDSYFPLNLWKKLMESKYDGKKKALIRLIRMWRYYISYL